MKLSISKHFHNKVNNAPARFSKKRAESSNLYAMAAFDNVDWSTEQIASHIKSGKAICVANLKGNWRNKDNFVSSQIMGIDFEQSPDISPTITALINNEFIRTYAFMVYATPSHTDDNPRSRVLFALDEPISDADEYKRLVSRLLAKFGQFGADEQCKDWVRIFYGSDVPVKPAASYSKRLPLSVLRDLPKTDDELKPVTTERPYVPFVPTDDRQIEIALKYANTTRRNIIDEALENNTEGYRHGVFISATMKLIARRKGGYPGYDTIENDIRWLGSVMARDKSEIDDAISSAERKCSAVFFPVLANNKRESPVKFIEADADEYALEVASATPLTHIVGQTVVNSKAPLGWKSNGEGQQHFRDRLVFPPQELNTPIPMVFPIKALHRFGGLCRVVKPGYVMALAGGSGTTKTGFVETMIGEWLIKTRMDVLWWGLEMDWRISADRAVQRLGGTSVTDNFLHELWLSEDYAKTPMNEREGVRLHPSKIAENQRISGFIEHQVVGRIHQIEEPIRRVKDVLEAFADKSADLRKNGGNPCIAVFDYAQLAEIDGTGSDAQRMTALNTMIKKHAFDHQYFGIVVSQITKNASANAKRAGELIGMESAQNFRSDDYNLAITLNPVYHDVTGEITRKGIVKVDKNTFGKPGNIMLWIDPARYTWLDSVVGESEEPQ